MPRNNKDRDSLPESFKTVDEFIEFWDTHNLGDSGQPAHHQFLLVSGHSTCHGPLKSTCLTPQFRLLRGSWRRRHRIEPLLSRSPGHGPGRW